VRAARNWPAKSSRIREWGMRLRGLLSRSIADANFERATWRNSPSLGVFANHFG
jgi:hypothetical protein